MPHALEKNIKKLIKQQNLHKLGELLETTNLRAITQILNFITAGKAEAFSLLSPQRQAQIITQLSPQSQRVILSKISFDQLMGFIHYNDSDDIIDILKFVKRDVAKAVLNKLSIDKSEYLKKILENEQHAAAAITDFNFILIPDTFTIKDVANKIQQHLEHGQPIPAIVVTSEEGIQGYIPHKNLILSAPSNKLTNLISPLPFIRMDASPNIILKKARVTKAPALGVIDRQHNLLGIIHTRSLLKMAQSEASRMLYNFAGVQKEEDASDPISTKVRYRYQWLIINLGTGFLAAAVVSLFEETISQLAVLAVYMSIVAGEGGNAATQSLAVVVRSLATGDIPLSQARGIIMREGIAGLVNGLIVGIISAAAALIFQAPVELGFVLAIAMTANLFVAGLFGALIPFILKYFKIDPATASSVIVTTVTDIVGFFVFLSLGATFLL